MFCPPYAGYTCSWGENCFEILVSITIYIIHSLNQENKHTKLNKLIFILKNKKDSKFFNWIAFFNMVFKTYVVILINAFSFLANHHFNDFSRCVCLFQILLSVCHRFRGFPNFFLDVSCWQDESANLVLFGWVKFFIDSWFFLLISQRVSLFWWELIYFLLVLLVSFGSCRFLLVSIGFHCYLLVTWFLLVPCGSCWFLLVPVGSCWFLLVPVCSCLFLFVPVGSCWFLLVPVGSCLFLLVPVGSCWFLLVPVDSCLFLLVPGGSWWFLVVPGGSYWFLLVPVGSCWFLLVPIGSYDCYWFL